MRYFLHFFLLFGFEAQAYLGFMPNDHLAEEVRANPDRILPRNDFYSLAIDGDFFKPVFFGPNNFTYYKYDFYHGNGYWVDLRAEFKPSQNLVLNLKTDFTHGTSSNGPTYLSLIVPHLGFTYRPENFFGLNWEARLSDIGRQTIGNGLFIEKKETDGGYLTAASEDFFGKMMVDGTGSFRLEGGVVSFDLSVYKGLFGLSYLIQETNTDFNAPSTIGSLYSRHQLGSGLSYGAEWGVNSATWANLIFFQFESNIGGFNFLLKPQFRHYGKGILGNLPRRVGHNYISYDQNDKPFTSLMNIFSYGDNVETYSMNTNLEYVFNHFYKVYVETEAIQFRFREREMIQAVYFRTGFKFHPFKNRNDELGVLFGNKYLIASTSESGSAIHRTYSSPLLSDFENKPLFMKQNYGMINFTTRF